MFLFMLGWLLCMIFIFFLWLSKKWCAFSMNQWWLLHLWLSLSWSMLLLVNFLKLLTIILGQHKAWRFNCKSNSVVGRMGDDVFREFSYVLMLFMLFFMVYLNAFGLISSVLPFSFLTPHVCLPETALKLDNLIGDIEDAVSYTMSKNTRRHSSDQNSEVSTLS